MFQDYIHTGLIPHTALIDSLDSSDSQGHSSNNSGVSNDLMTSFSTSTKLKTMTLTNNMNSGYWIPDPHCARELNDIDFVEADAEADTSFCRVCHATSQTPGNVPGLASMKMVTKSKCWFCHATHLLAYGDTTWKDCSTSVLWIHFLANIRVLDIPNPNIPRHDSWISFFAEGDVFFVVVVLLYLF